MRERRVMKRPLVLHPFLLAVLPVLFLYAHNIGELSPDKLAWPVGIVVVASVALWAVLAFALRDGIRAGLISSVVWVSFFSFGHLYRLLARREAEGFTISAGALFGIVYCLIVAVAILMLVEKRRGYDAATAALNLAAGALVAWQLVWIGGHEIQRLRVSRSAPTAATIAASEAPDQGLRPNIYLIVLDSYARADVLRDVFRHDNTGFLQHLSQRGFRVVPHAVANYCQTSLALAACLNLDYLDRLAAQAGRPSPEGLPLGDMIRHSRLMTFLRQRGYRVVTFVSGCEATDLKSADVRMDLGSSLDEFENAVLNTTPLPVIASRLGQRSANQVEAHARRILYTLDHLADASKVRPPVFVFAHVMCPHPPFVFDRNGIRRDLPDMLDFTADLARDYNAEYREQVQYLNRRVQAGVDRVLATANRPTVIVIMSDHGPPSSRPWDDADKANLRERMGTLLAYYLPDDGEEPVIDDLSGVNIFRLVLNRYFATNMQLLPNESYFSLPNHPYRFTRATDKVNPATAR
jgi:hypothetical protein